jgi:hypothetical protein
VVPHPQQRQARVAQHPQQPQARVVLHLQQPQARVVLHPQQLLARVVLYPQQPQAKLEPKLTMPPLPRHLLLFQPPLPLKVPERPRGEPAITLPRATSLARTVLLLLIPQPVVLPPTRLVVPIQTLQMRLPITPMPRVLRLSPVMEAGRTEQSRLLQFM